MSVDDFEDRIKDPNFIKRLEKVVTQWIRDIRKITQMNNDITAGSGQQEINFWISIERSLENIQEQLTDERVLITKEILNRANKFTFIIQF